MKIRVRHQGYSVTIDAKPDMVFRQVASDLFKSYNITTDIAEYCFRIQNHDVYFKLAEPLSKLLEIAWAFREKDQEEEVGGNVEVTIVLIRQAEKGDMVLRQKTTPDANTETTFVGYLYKRGRSTFGNISGFKRRWFTLQSNTLFYSISPQDEISGFIPCIDLKVRLRPENSTKDKTAFELLYSDPTASLTSAAPITGSRSRGDKAQGDRMCYSLLADERELPFFLDAVETLQVRTAKAAFVNIGQELLSRGPATLHGIFRVSGSSDQVQHLKKCIDYGLGPDLSCEDTHTLSAVAKLYLRQLTTPLIPYGLYNEFLRIGKMNHRDEKIQFAIEAIQKLPLITLNFLHYICDFMHQISLHAATNAMTCENLSICLSPNLLRPEKESPQTTLNDNKFVIASVHALFEHCEEIFGPFPGLRYTLNKTTPTSISKTTDGYPTHALPPLPISPVSNNSQSQSEGGPRLSMYPPPKPQHQLQPRSTASPSSLTTEGTSPSSSSSLQVEEMTDYTFTQGRGRTMSIADLDFELSYFEDLKAVRAKTKRLAEQIQSLHHAHSKMMSRWDELISAIRANPHASVSMAEFILERTELNTSWVDDGLDELNHVGDNLSEIVSALKQHNRDQLKSSQQATDHHHSHHAQHPSTAESGDGNGHDQYPSHHAPSSSYNDTATAIPPSALSSSSSSSMTIAAPELSPSACTPLSLHKAYSSSSSSSSSSLPSSKNGATTTTTIPHTKPPPIPPSPRAGPVPGGVPLPGFPTANPPPPRPLQQPPTPHAHPHLHVESITPPITPPVTPSISRGHEAPGTSSAATTTLPPPPPSGYIPPPPPRSLKPQQPQPQPQQLTPLGSLMEDIDFDDMPPPPPPPPEDDEDDNDNSSGGGY